MLTTIAHALRVEAARRSRQAVCGRFGSAWWRFFGPSRLSFAWQECTDFSVCSLCRSLARAVAIYVLLLAGILADGDVPFPSTVYGAARTGGTIDLPDPAAGAPLHGLHALNGTNLPQCGLYHWPVWLAATAAAVLLQAAAWRCLDRLAIYNPRTGPNPS